MRFACSDSNPSLILRDPAATGDAPGRAHSATSAPGGSPSAAQPPAPAAAPLMLSVSGARGLVGQTMTPEVAAPFAAAFGSELRALSRKEHPLVVIGRDSRPSGEMLEHAAVAGLIGAGCRVIRLGIVTTPTVAVMSGHHHADGGMVITASHNPIVWNGLKFLNADGVAPPKAEAKRIIERYKNRTIDYVDVHHVVPVQTDDSSNRVHVDRVLTNFDPAAVHRAGFRVVLDSVNGAGCVAGRMLLEQLNCSLHHMNGEPHGRFAHMPEPIREHLGDLCADVREQRADIGFAQDPDADRLVFVDENGTYVGEEYSLALAVEHMLGVQLSAEEARRAVVVVNLSTSRMVQDIAERYGARVALTPVGEANIVEYMKSHEGCVGGGEGNGGVIWPKVCYVRDSLSGMALILDLMARRRARVSELVRALPPYSIVKAKLPVQPGLADRGIEQVAERYRNAKVDRQDGIRVDFPDRKAWVALRASNTEPIIRIIAEALSVDAAQALVDEVKTILDAAR